MALTYTPVKLNWDAQIDEKINLIQYSIRTGDFQAFYSSYGTVDTIDHAATFHSLVEQLGLTDKVDTATATNKINNLNEQSLQNEQNTYEDFSKKVEDLKNNKTTDNTRMVKSY